MGSEYFEYPVNGVLDLHMFRPDEVESVLSEYLVQCRMRGILHVRIIHGKGRGVLRQLVGKYLKSCPSVREFSTAEDASSWGATIAVLAPMDSEND